MSLRKEFGQTYTTLFYRVKHGAVERGLEFALTIEQVIVLRESMCAYCGKPAEPFNGIDRIDPSQGYIWTNCVPCCPSCNSAKKDYPLMKFVQRCFLFGRSLSISHPRILAMITGYILTQTDYVIF